MVVACLGSSALRRTREKVDLPLFLGPHTTTTGGVGSEETVVTTQAQSDGTTTSVRAAGEDDRGGVRVGVARVPAMSRCLPQRGELLLLPPAAVSSVLQNPLAQFHSP